MSSSEEARDPDRRKDSMSELVSSRNSGRGLSISDMPAAPRVRDQSSLEVDVRL